jgi:hypothetical protein
MTSHLYEFTGRDLLRICVPSLLPVALFTLIMHFGAASGLLPAPCPALDTDRTILFHQARASIQSSDAGLVLIGDSSCLMNVAATQLDEMLDHSVLNLGTLSYLDLRAFATILQRYVATNPNRLRIIVLLMHPEALRRPSPTEYHTQALAHFYQGTDFCGPALSPLLCALGVEIFRGRILSRLVPQPLAGSYGRFYGFSHDLWGYLSENQGSALDPGAFDPQPDQGYAEYRLAASLEQASKAFRASVPEGAILAVGITPVPDTCAEPGYHEFYQEMLDTWGRWLKADITLPSLPPSLPEHLFANPTHLNARGVQLYTSQLAQNLSASLNDVR